LGSVSEGLQADGLVERLLNIFILHAANDAPFADELKCFLETGCDGICITPDSAIRPGQDLLSTAETVDSADVLVLLLSPASNPVRWRREIWEPMIAGHTHVLTFLLEECTFPPLLRRGLGFFDGTITRLAAMRQLKRWIWGIRHGTSPAMNLSSDLEPLYVALGDRPGIATASGPMAERFAQQAFRDFEGVFWVPSRGRAPVEIAGDLGAQLEMTLDGPLAENCRRIRDVLAARRCLVVFDAPEVVLDAIVPSGRTSVLFTAEAVRIVDDVRNFAAARALVVARRFAEAYEILYELFNAGIETEACARELVWICEHWDRVEEANALRFQFRPSSAEQMRLF
jgi:hypothetical protein